QHVYAGFANSRLELRIRSSAVCVACQQIVCGKVFRTPLTVFVEFTGIDVSAGWNAALVRCEGDLRLGTTHSLEPGAGVVRMRHINGKYEAIHHDNVRTVGARMRDIADVVLNS